MKAELTTTNTAGATANYSAVVGPMLPLPARALFEVEVDGLLGFSLIPRNALAKDLAGVWLHGTIKTSLHSIGVLNPEEWDYKKRRQNVTRLECHVEVEPLLASGGDPFYTGRHISTEEHAVALAAIEAHREAKRPKPASKRKRSR